MNKLKDINWTKVVIFKTDIDYHLADGSVRHMHEGDMLIIEERDDGAIVDHPVPSDVVPEVAAALGLQEYLS